MEIATAQEEVRHSFLHGAPGMLVSGVFWLASAALASAGRVQLAMVALFVAGMFIFPASTLLLRAMGRSGALPSGHPFTALGMQAAFIVPLGWPLVVAAGIANRAWYFPAAALLVAIHYLPFMTLYGMRLFGVLAGVLMLGVALAVWFDPSDVALGAWVTGGIEVAFAAIAFHLARRRAIHPTRNSSIARP